MERLFSHMHKKERAPQDWDNGFDVEIVNFFTKPVEKYINAHVWSILTLFAEKMSSLLRWPSFGWLSVRYKEGQK